MALKLRRGIEAERLGITPAEGELLYVTDHVTQDVSPLWVGDGTTPGGNAVATMSEVLSVNGSVGDVVLSTNDIAEPLVAPTNLWFTNDRAKDAAGAALTGGTHTGVSFTYDNEAKTISAAISAAGIVDAGVASELGYYASTGSTISSTGSKLTWNSTTSTFAISAGYLDIKSDVGGRSIVVFESSYDIDDSSSVSLRRSKGTAALPTVIGPNDFVYNIAFQGYDGAAFHNAASILVKTSGTISTGIIPSTMYLRTTGPDGVIDPRVRITETGRVIIGPTNANDTGSGRIDLRQVVSQTTESAMAIRNTFSDANPVQIALSKYRGTIATPTTVLDNDIVSDIRSFGYDGTNARGVATIRSYVNGTVSSGKVPGALAFGVANNVDGAMTITTRITSDKRLTHTGDVVVTNGTVTATEFISTGTGTPSLVSATNLDLSAAAAVRIIGGGTFRLPQLTTLQRDALVAAPGDMIYNTTDNKVQAYQGGGSPAWFNIDGTP